MTFIDTILAASENLLTYRGDSINPIVYFYEDEANTIPYNDLSTWDELEFTVRRNKNSIQAVLVKDLIEGLSVSSNALTMVLTAEDMNLLHESYYFDVQGKMSSGEVGTVWQGLIGNVNDVTK